MFGFTDLWKFFVGFFLIFPIVSIVHQAGHVFFARLFGAKIKFTLGVGKKLFQYKAFEIRKIYFLDAWCHYENVANRGKWVHVLIYSGGTLFNAVTVLIVNYLILKGVLTSSLFFYQFVYFSVYFIFFALFPVEYRKDHPSDGLAIFYVLKYGKAYDPID
ncbi:hypothetical protein [Pseudalkalibacillus decolorationis]|uniref:hypothetical protein n=1 Tax=Pseudalkalibacillus decolorationis TaxID=163879 RepID=UPI0021484A43|nr:hypothetical protein [Pseudalkalibacillus decolorationis]